MTRTRLLWVAAAVVVLNCVVVRATDLTVVRVAVGLPSLLLAPGLLVTIACTPPRASDWATVITFSVAASLAVVALGSILLDAVGIPLGAEALSVWVAAVGVEALGIALLRWRDEPACEGPRIAMSGGGMLASVASIAMVTTALAFSVSWAHDRPESNRVAGFTELSVVPAQRGAVAVTVRSNETRPMEYAVRITQPPGSADAASFALRPGREWRGRFTVGQAGKVTVMLRSVHGEVLRRSVSIDGSRAVQP